MRNANSSVRSKREVWGNGLIKFCGIGLILSSLFKFSQLPGPVAYMASLGYQGGVYFFVAALELAVAIIFLRRSTRPLGLLLVSAYFGGAISAHLAAGNPSLARGPYMAFLLTHPLVGVIPACLLLASAWLGVWLSHPELSQTFLRPNSVNRPSTQLHQDATLLARP